MIELGYTKVIVIAEEGADLYAEADKNSEVIGHLNPETEAWVRLNEEKTWGQLYTELTEEVEEADEEVAKDEAAPAQFIFMEGVTVVKDSLNDEIIFGFTVAWNDDKHTIDSVAHLTIDLEQEETLPENYVLQWQYSKDDSEWIDIENANDDNIYVAITIENFKYYWRVIATPIRSPESAE